MNQTTRMAKRKQKKTNKLLYRYLSLLEKGLYLGSNTIKKSKIIKVFDEDEISLFYRYVTLFKSDLPFLMWIKFFPNRKELSISFVAVKSVPISLRLESKIAKLVEKNELSDLRPILERGAENLGLFKITFSQTVNSNNKIRVIVSKTINHFFSKKTKKALNPILADIQKYKGGVNHGFE